MKVKAWSSLFAFALIFSTLVYFNSQLNQPTLTGSQNNIIYGVGYIGSGDEYYEYNNDIVSIPLKIDNINSDINIGILAFLDGIPQQIIMDDRAESYSFMKNIQLESATKSTFILQFKPSHVVSNTISSLRILTMLQPSKSYDKQNYFFGNNHAIMQIDLARPFNIVAGSQHNVQHVYASNFVNIQYDKYLLDSDNSQNLPCAFLYQENPLISTFSDLDKPLTFDFIAFGKQTYRTTFFANHQPVSFNNGKGYLEFTTQLGKAVSEQIILDVDPGDVNFIYCITVPLDSENQDVIKTKSMAMFKR